MTVRILELPAIQIIDIISVDRLGGQLHKKIIIIITAIVLLALNIFPKRLLCHLRYYNQELLLKRPSFVVISRMSFVQCGKNERRISQKVKNKYGVLALGLFISSIMLKSPFV